MLNCNYSDTMINCNGNMYRSNSYSNEGTFSSWPYAYQYSQEPVNTSALNSNQFINNTNPTYMSTFPQPIFPQPVAARDLRMRMVRIEDICG